jgi:hypothetical protein
MSCSLRRIATIVLCAAVLAIPATASAQREDEPFRRGLDARRDKNYPAVVEAMRQAITLNRMESTRKVGARPIFGGGTEYLPYYFLGEALKARGDCVGAVAAWEVSEEQKVVVALPYYTDLRAGYKECQSKGVLLRDDLRTQTALTEQLYRETLDSYNRITKLKDSNQDLWRPDAQDEFDRARNDLALAQKTLLKAGQSRFLADFSESRTLSNRAAGVLRPLETRFKDAIGTRALIRQQSTQAQEILAAADATDREIDAAKVALPPDLATSRDGARASLRSARERLGQAEKTQNAATASEALRLAQDASDAFGKVLELVRKLVRSEAEQRFQQVLAAATEQFSFVGNSIATLERRVAEKSGTVTPEMTSRRDELVKEYSALQRRLDNARRSENTAGVEQVMRLLVEARVRIDDLITAFGPLTLIERGVHSALDRGARSYLAGAYQEALTVLDPLVGRSDITLQVHVHLFRAASLHALYMRSGETNQSLLNDAIAAVQRSKEIDPSLTPDGRAFSPRFLSFYQNPSSPAQTRAPSSQ